MNYKNLVLSLGLAAASVGVASAQAAPPRPPVQASEVRLTVNLSLEYQIPNLKRRDSAGKNELGPRRTTNSWTISRGSTPSSGAIIDDTIYHELGQTSVRARYGNAELIADLVAQGALSSTVSGWYISAFVNPQGQIYAIYARNSTNTTTLRLDPTYIQFASTQVTVPAPVVPALTQVPPTADPAASIGAVDRYAYNDSFRFYDGPTRTESTYITKGTRTTSTRYALTITTNRFPTPLTGLIRFDNVSNANPGAAFPPTWIIKSIESKAVILAGTRNIANELGTVVATPVLVDGTISGKNGIAYDNSTITQSTYPALPPNIVAP